MTIEQLDVMLDAQNKANPFADAIKFPMKGDYDGTNLSGVAFYESITESRFIGANLRETRFIGIDISWVGFSLANLSTSVFDRCYFNEVSFRGANLVDAVFINCKFKDCDFTAANLYNTRFTACNLPLKEYMKGKVLTEDIIGYKGIRQRQPSHIGMAIATLKIPKGAMVFSINGDKCRTNKAIVLDISSVYNPEKKKYDRGRSIHNGMSYYVGDEFTIHNFDCQYNKECSTGIHFFMSREEAINYVI